MGNWSLVGILFMISIFFMIFAFVLAQINVINPYTNIETSALSVIINWIIP